MLCQSQSRNKMLSFFIVFASTYLQPCIKCNPTVLVPVFVFLFIIYSQNLRTNSNTGVIINRLIVNALMEIYWKWKWKCFTDISTGLFLWKWKCLFCKTISKVRFEITVLWISLKKGEWFDFNHSLRSLPYFIHQNWTSGSSVSFGLGDLLSLSII